MVIVRAQTLVKVGQLSTERWRIKMRESANASLSEEGMNRLLFREQGQAINSFVLFQGVLLLIRYVGVSQLVIGGGRNPN